VTHPLSIIDRLVGDASPAEDVSSVVETLSRDLVLLLNSWEILPAAETPYSDEMQASVLNYGVPNMAGKSTRPSILSNYEKQVRIAVLRFEPRLDPSTLTVEVALLPPPAGSSEFGLRIEGELLGLETRRRVQFRSRVSASTGRVVLV
jgi:type VI secretion system protein ImpF